MAKSNKRVESGSADFQKALGIIRRRKGGMMDGFAEMRLASTPRFLRRVAPDFAAHAAYRPLTLKAPFPKSVSDLRAVGFRYWGSFAQELAWLTGVLSRHVATLKEFVSVRGRYEALYLQGLYEDAEAVLAGAEAKWGFSVWLVQRRIDLITQTSTASARNRYVGEVLADGGPGLIHFLMAWFNYRSAATVSRSEYERFLGASAPLTQGAHFLVHADAGFYPEVSPTRAAQILARTDVFPLIDRYQWLLLATGMLVSSELAVDEVRQALDDFARPLAEDLSDPVFNRIIFSERTTNGPSPNEPLLALIDEYSKGQYDAVRSTYVASAYPEALIESLNIALRSSVAFGDDTPPIAAWGIDVKSVLGRIAIDLFEVLRFGQGGVEARLRLNKLVLTHATQQWAASLALILERQRSDERLSTTSRAQRNHAMRSSTDHPILAFAYQHSDLIRAYLKAASNFDPGSITAKALMAIAANLPVDELAALPASRVQHVRALQLLRSGDAAGAAASLERLRAMAGPGILKDEGALLLVACHLASGEVAEAAELTAELFVSQRYFGLVLPVAELVDALMVGHDQPMSASKTRGKISVAVIFDMYSRFLAADRDAERADAFNDVLRRYGVQRASQLPAEVPPDLLPQLIYFLRYICVPEVMDQSLVLDDTKSVEDERLAVLLVLTDLVEAEDPALDVFKDEIREIRTRQVVRDTALKLDQSKIYVNIDGIRRTLDVETRENWNRYRFMVDNGGGFGIEEIESFLMKTSQEEPLNVLMVRLDASYSERLALLKRIVSEVRDQFTLNKEFGLNSNLSANIRHGYVLRELRAPLVARYLVTNLISDQRGYNPNSYWPERFEVFWDDDDLVTSFQTVMSDFSQKIDQRIDRLNRVLLRIKTEVNPEGLFDYTISDVAMTSLDEKWLKIDTYEEFMEAILDAMWSATERNLKWVRRELEGQVLQQFMVDLDELDDKLEQLGVKSRLPGIGDAITMAKTDMRAAVDRVGSWFTLSGNHEYADFDLEIAFEAGLASVKAYYADLRISHSYSAKPSSIMLQGWSLPGFARLFFQLLDNAAKHGGRGRDELNIVASVELENEGLLIHLENDLSEDESLPELEARVAELNAEYGQAKQMELIGEEGGSGYPKIWKLVRSDLKRDHDINILVNENGFAVDILMNTGGILCRPS